MPLWMTVVDGREGGICITFAVLFVAVFIGLLIRGAYIFFGRSK